MKAKNILFYSICLTFLFLPSFVFAGEKPVNFVVFGHVYPDYEAVEKSVEKVNALNPDFIAFLGDTLPPDHQTEWDEIRSITGKFDAPVYFVPGNHDIEDRVGDKAYFVENVNPLYQTFTERNITFVTLNSSNVAPLANFDVVGEQIEWLENVYKKDKSKKILFVHHCLFYQDEAKLCNNRGQKISEENNWNVNVLPVIREDTIAVFTGDVGTKQPYYSYAENGVDYFGVGFARDKLKYPQHFLYVEVSEDSLSVRPVLIEDQLVDINSLNKKEKAVSFRESVPKFSYERLRIIIITYLKKITALSVAGNIFLVSLFIFLFFKQKKGNENK